MLCRAWSVDNELNQEAAPSLGSEVLWWTGKPDEEMNVQQTTVAGPILAAQGQQMSDVDMQCM